ncbi:MAG: hypothetical protein WDM91_02230 [Rhizomicrobium sp.]
MLQDWTGFFAAELGASAALAGLVIVAISINIARILADPVLPGRAAETLVAPTGVLILCSFALVPGQGRAMLAAEILVTGAAMGLVPALIIGHALRRGVDNGYALRRLVLAGMCFLPFVVSGGLLLAGVPGALYWTVPGVVLSLLATVLNAWVLLVEILR